MQQAMVECMAKTLPSWAVVFLRGLLFSVLFFTVLHSGTWRADKVMGCDQASLKKFDQSAYLQTAQRYAEDWSCLGKRNRMPMYTRTLAVFMKIADERGAAFARWASVLLAVLTLWPIWRISERSCGLLSAFVLTAVYAATIVVYRSGFIQCEVLFYFTFFIACVCAASALRSLSPWAGAFSGGAIAICWLTKGSGLLLLPLFIGCQCLGIAIKFIHRDSAELKARCFSVLLACVAFATVGGTYGWHSYKLYGSPIYNANQRYMWTNNFSHYKAVWKAKKSGVDLAKNVDPSAGDRFAKWGVDGPSLGLTAREWFARNGWDGVGKRLRSGLRRNWQILTGSKHTYGCHIFLAVGTALIVLGVVCRRRRAGVLLKQYGLPLCGFIGMLAAYWLFYAWYTPVAWGGRFIASLFLPYYFCLFITWTKLTEGCSRPVQWAMPFAQALVLAYWLVFIMPVVILRYNGG